MDFAQYLRSPVFINLLMTVVMVITVLIVRGLWARSIRRNDHLPIDVRRAWLVRLRNGAILLLVMGVGLVWGRELQPLAVSLMAFAVAVVIGTKELLQCLLGSFLRTAGRSFGIGDRIEVAGHRGDVIDMTALTTTLLEIGPDHVTHQLSGRAIVLPNSLFLTHTVTNESFTDEFVLHAFKVPLKLTPEWPRLEAALIEAANTECAPFLDKAKEHFRRLGEHEGLVSMSVAPRITVSMPQHDELELVVRIAVPARRKGRIEQRIMRRFLLTGWPGTAVAEVQDEAD